MNRPLALVIVLCLLGLIPRWLSPPVYYGTPEQPEPSRIDALGAPFGDDLKGSCNAFLSLLAESLRREGLAATGGIPLLNVRTSTAEDFWYYDHHTPGIPLCTAVAFTLFGASELTTRLVALAFATATAAVLLFAVARVSGAGPTVAAAAALFFLPMGLYWATHLNYEVPTMAPLTAFLILALGGERGRPRRGLAGIAFLLAFCLDLVALAGIAAVAFERLVFRPRRPREALAWCGLAALSLTGWWLWKTAQVERWGHVEGGSTLHHLAAVSMLAPGFDLGHWLQVAPGHVIGLAAGWPAAVLAVELILAHVDAPLAPLTRWLRASSIVALLAFVIPANRSIDHPYYALYFLVPTALAFASMARRIASLGERLGLGPLAVPVASLALVLTAAVPGLDRELARAAPDPGRPAAHRVGKELAAALPEQDAVLAVEPGAPFHLLTLSYYAGAPVVMMLPEDPDARLLRETWLRSLGLEAGPLYLARDPLWPGRGGLVRLPLRE